MTGIKLKTAVKSIFTERRVTNCIGTMSTILMIWTTLIDFFYVFIVLNYHFIKMLYENIMFIDLKLVENQIQNTLNVNN